MLKVEPIRFGMIDRAIWEKNRDINDSIHKETPLIKYARLNLMKINTEWSRNIIQDAVISVVDMLNHSEDLSNTYIKNHKKIKVLFKGKGLAECLPIAGELRFGDKFFDYDIINVGGIGYQKEQPFIQNRCILKRHLITWLILHEYQHLFIDMQKHNDIFFNEINKKSLKYWQLFL